MFKRSVLMWIKFLLLSVLPLIALYIAYIVFVGKLPTETVWFKHQAEYAEKWKKVRASADQAGTELIVYGATKDKAALDRYTKARADLAAGAAELPPLAGQTSNSNDIEDAAKNLLDKLELFKKDVAESPKVDAAKLSADSEGWQEASRKLDFAIQMVIITELVSTPALGLTMAGVVAGVVWALLVLIFSLSCFMRYTAVRHNIRALASGQPLKPQSKFGCWDEISKLDKVVHEVAAAKNAG